MLVETHSIDASMTASLSKDDSVVTFDSRSASAASRGRAVPDFGGYDDAGNDVASDNKNASEVIVARVPLNVIVWAPCVSSGRVCQGPVTAKRVPDAALRHGLRIDDVFLITRPEFL